MFKIWSSFSFVMTMLLRTEVVSKINLKKTSLNSIQIKFQIKIYFGRMK